MTRTYKQVFGVELGGELRMKTFNWVGCPAVNALQAVLRAHSFFAGARLGGTGSVAVHLGNDVWKHEFNRHNGGVAVDIMLARDDASPEVALGHHLVRLFEKHHATMKWRSIIYRHYTNNPGGGTDLDHPGCYKESDHLDHIHIDWFKTATGRRPDITEVDLRVSDQKGERVVKAKAIQSLSWPKLQKGAGIPDTIVWPPEASTDFSRDQALQADLADLMTRHANGELEQLDLGEVCQPASAARTSMHSPDAGDWVIWFTPDGDVVHPDSPAGAGGPGRFRTARTSGLSRPHEVLHHPRAPRTWKGDPLHVQDLIEDLDA